MHFRQTMPTPMQAGAKNKGNFKIVLRCFDWRRRRRCRWRRRFVSLLSRNFWAAFCDSKWQRCQKILLARRPKIQIKSWAEWKAFTSPLTSPLIFLITEFLSLKYLNTFIQLLHWHRGKSFRKSWMICGLLHLRERPIQPVVKQSNANFKDWLPWWWSRKKSPIIFSEVTVRWNFTKVVGLRKNSVVASQTRLEPRRSFGNHLEKNWMKPRKRECVCVCERERERESNNILSLRHWERALVCVCVCVWMHMGVYVSVWKLDRECISK